MAKPEEDLILAALLDLHKSSGLDTTALTKWYEAEKKILDSKTASSKEKQEVLKRQKAVASALPALASGLRDAVQSFRNGNPLAGSAAVMDICTTLSSTIASLSAVPGPAALVGALFSVISMILKSFGPPQKSLSQQLEQVIRTLDSEKQIDGLKTANQAIRVSMDIMLAGKRKWTFTELMVQLNIAEGDSIGKIRGAAEWLGRPSNQELPLWSQVLAAQCHTYSYFMQACTLATASLDVAFDDVKALAAGFRACNADQLTFLQGIQSAAGRRGTVWTIGTFESRGQWPEAGHLYVRDTAKGDWKSLGGEQRAFTASMTRRDAKDVSDPYPYLAIFALEQGDTEHVVPTFAYRYRKNARTYGIFGSWPLSSYDGWIEIKQLEGLHDLCATPGEKDGEVYLYTANGKKIERWVHSGKRSDSGDIELTRSDIQFEIAGTQQAQAVCAVSLPRSAPNSGVVSLAGEKWVAYAAGEKGFIRAYFSGGTGSLFASPRGEMLGMKVDSTYLWVFTRRFIACTAHAEVKRFCEQLKTREARKAVLAWAFYNIPAAFGGSWQTPGHFDGLHDLSPCDDGTLMAVFYDAVRPPSVGRKLQRVYQARPEIDLAKKVITIQGTKRDNFGHSVRTLGWEVASSETEEAHRVQKQPIFCWPLVEGLTQSLLKQKKAVS